MTDKDIKEHHKMIKKLEKQVEEELYGQKENDELAESYKESQRQTKERKTKERTKPLASFSKDLQESIHKRTYVKLKDHATDMSYENETKKK